MYQELFKSLDKFSLNNDLYLRFMKKTENYKNDQSNVKKIKAPSVVKRVKNEYITPPQLDKLFWCFYIISNSVDDYESINNNHFRIEKDMKIEFVDIIRKNRSLLRENKLKKVDIEDELINEKKITLKTFFLFCIYHEIDAIFIANNFYYELPIKFDNSDNPHIITLVNGNYSIDLKSKNLEFYRLNYCKMDNLSRHLKPISMYKLDELQSICLKLNINIEYSNGRKQTKADLYDNINACINSH